MFENTTIGLFIKISRTSRKPHPALLQAHAFTSFICAYIIFFTDCLTLFRDVVNIFLLGLAGHA